MSSISITIFQNKNGFSELITTEYGANEYRNKLIRWPPIYSSSNEPVNFLGPARACPTQPLAHWLFGQ